KLQNEMGVFGARFGIEVRRKTKEQHLSEKIEGRFFHRGVSTLSCGNRVLDNLSVFVSHGLPWRQVRSINRKTRDGFAHRPRECLECEIAIPSVLLRKPIEH